MAHVGVDEGSDLVDVHHRFVVAVRSSWTAVLLRSSVDRSRALLGVGSLGRLRGGRGLEGDRVPLRPEIDRRERDLFHGHVDQRLTAARSEGHIALPAPPCAVVHIRLKARRGGATGHGFGTFLAPAGDGTGEHRHAADTTRVLLVATRPWIGSRLPSRCHHRDLGGAPGGRGAQLPRVVFRPPPGHRPWIGPSRHDEVTELSQQVRVLMSLCLRERCARSRSEQSRHPQPHPRDTHDLTHVGEPRVESPPENTHIPSRDPRWLSWCGPALFATSGGT